MPTGAAPRADALKQAFDRREERALLEPHMGGEMFAEARQSPGIVALQVIEQPAQQAMVFERALHERLGVGAAQQQQQRVFLGAEVRIQFLPEGADGTLAGCVDLRRVARPCGPLAGPGQRQSGVVLAREGLQ